MNDDRISNDDLRYKTLLEFGRILGLFESGQREEKSVTNISKLLGILPSKTSRMLRTLDHIGLFEKNPETGRYRLGGRFLQIGLLYALNDPLRRIILPHLELIHVEQGLAASWAIFTNDRVIIVDRVGVQGGVKIHLLGSSPPLHSSSYGKVFLANLESEKREQAIRSLNPVKITSRTKTDPVALREELELVRKRGYASDIGESIEDVLSICAPIKNQNDHVVAGLAMGSSMGRLPIEKFLGFHSYLIEKALFVSRQLGYM